MVDRGREAHQAWTKTYDDWAAREPERKELLDRMLGRDLPVGWEKALPSWEVDAKGVATRKASGEVLKALADVLPELWGGSADLAESNNTTMEGADSFGPTVDRHQDVGGPARTAAPCTSGSASTPWARSSTASRCTARPGPTAAPSWSSPTTCAPPSGWPR